MRAKAVNVDWPPRNLKARQSLGDEVSKKSQILFGSIIQGGICVVGGKKAVR